jgi:transposase InsO family protein
VNTHQNARLTPWSRGLLVQRLSAGERVSHVARAFGVSRQTVRKWRTRYQAEGAPGLRDRSSRPKRSPRQLERSCREEIERLRRAGSSSPQIARALCLPLSTVILTLKRLGLSHLSALQVQPPVVRYQRARAGELVHLDTKKLARITKIGHRIHGDPRGRRTGTGWELLYVAIDDATRLAYLEVLPDERASSACAFVERACAWFAAQGVRTERVMTDNGKNFIAKRFRATLQAVGTRHVRTRPYRPQTNGKAERFIQTCLREWAYVRPYHTSQERTAALGDFLDYYNRQRPHLGIHGRSPQQRLAELQCEQRP